MTGAVAEATGRDLYPLSALEEERMTKARQVLKMPLPEISGQPDIAEDLKAEMEAEQATPKRDGRTTEGPLSKIIATPAPKPYADEARVGNLSRGAAEAQVVLKTENAFQVTMRVQRNSYPKFLKAIGVDVEGLDNDNHVRLPALVMMEVVEHVRTTDKVVNLWREAVAKAAGRGLASAQAMRAALSPAVIDSKLAALVNSGVMVVELGVFDWVYALAPVAQGVPYIIRQHFTASCSPAVKKLNETLEKLTLVGPDNSLDFVGPYTEVVTALGEVDKAGADPNTTKAYNLLGRAFAEATAAGLEFRYRGVDFTIAAQAIVDSMASKGDGAATRAELDELVLQLEDCATAQGKRDAARRALGITRGAAGGYSQDAVARIERQRGPPSKCPNPACNEKIIQGHVFCSACAWLGDGSWACAGCGLMSPKSNDSCKYIYAGCEGKRSDPGSRAADNTDGSGDRRKAALMKGFLKPRF